VARSAWRSPLDDDALTASVERSHRVETMVAAKKLEPYR
jgi:hypothetical protein